MIVWQTNRLQLPLEPSLIGLAKKTRFYLLSQYDVGQVEIVFRTTSEENPMMEGEIKHERGGRGGDAQRSSEGRGKRGNTIQNNIRFFRLENMLVGTGYQ